MDHKGGAFNTTAPPPNDKVLVGALEAPPVSIAGTHPEKGWVWSPDYVQKQKPRVISVISERILGLLAEKRRLQVVWWSNSYTNNLCRSNVSPGTRPG
jgi:hypothetical protein